MKDPSLIDAIHAAGGNNALARAIGVTPSAVSQWDRVPAERVLQVERATGGKVDRRRLRPDLYADEAPAQRPTAAWCADERRQPPAAGL